MSAISRKAARRPRSRKPRSEDPRVVRSRAAVLDAARSLFLQEGYAGATMEEIALAAGLAKRTLYNNYADKAALFASIVEDTVAQAEKFARGLGEEIFAGITAGSLGSALEGLGRDLALAIVRPEVIALRRLLVGEAREFPDLATDYWQRAPGAVLEALASGFERLGRARLMRVGNPRTAAAQFAYLVAGELLDRSVLVGTIPPRRQVVAGARDGVRTFRARYLA